MKTFELDTGNWFGRYGGQKFYVMLSIPKSGRKDTFDIDVGSARSTGPAKFLCTTVRDVTRSTEAIVEAVKNALGVEK